MRTTSRPLWLLGVAAPALWACIAASRSDDPPPSSPPSPAHADASPGRCTVGRSVPSPPRRPAPTDAFEAADLDFRALYAGGRAATLRRFGPVIIVEGDRLVLLRGGRRTEATVIPPLYHRLKAVSHTPLALYVALAPHADEPPDDDRLGQLREFRTRIERVVAALDEAGFTAAQRTRSRRLLDACLGFLDGVLADRAYDPSELAALAGAAGPVVLANAADAARAQIDAYHAQVSAWRREIPADEWYRLRVLVMGRQTPRRHNVAVQYFAKLLGLPGESRRLVYAEELSGEAEALGLLATHQLDSEIGSAFFHDPDRMEIDLLGNAASVYLDGLDLDSPGASGPPARDARPARGLHR